MYTQLNSSPEAQTQQKALLYTALLSAVVLLLLFLARFTFTPPKDTVDRPVIDSLQIAYIPLRIERQPQRTPVAVKEVGGRAAAPVARWKPTPTEARPTEGLPGNSKPNIVSNQPSPVEEPKVDEHGLFKKVDKPGNGSTMNSRNTEGGNPNGQPGGSIAGPGGTGGIGLDLTGFRFGRLSVAPDPYDETGRIIFVVRVNAQGRVLSLTVKNTTVSPSVVAWYREQLERVTLVPTSSGDRPEISTGQISLKITAK
ncbi:hypothetical protein [Tellurirhabdus rosea]|uniref:hypothetical protein n=1 Tax=Tellurirhabdus rosea TaxID=2674997 RepID=UPI0022539719|nr:hypothetical protein [Tellurirhabdus rosea]